MDGLRVERLIHVRIGGRSLLTFKELNRLKTESKNYQARPRSILTFTEACQIIAKSLTDPNLCRVIDHTKGETVIQRPITNTWTK